MYIVEGLKHNLLSVSQIWDSGYSISLNGKGCSIKNENIKFIATSLRIGKNVYHVIDSIVLEWSLINNCLISQVKDNLLWHKRSGHINFHNLTRISKNSKDSCLSLIKKLVNICEDFAKEKQTRASRFSC